MIDDFDVSALGVTDFPYEGEFYDVTVDEEADLDQREPREVSVLKTVCDIQRRSRLHVGNFLGADYVVYFPLEENPESQSAGDRFGPIPVRRGMRFRSIAYGYPVDGIVEFVRPSQLGGCSVDIKVNTESDGD